MCFVALLLSIEGSEVEVHQLRVLDRQQVATARLEPPLIGAMPKKAKRSCANHQRKCRGYEGFRFWIDGQNLFSAPTTSRSSPSATLTGSRSPQVTHSNVAFRFPSSKRLLRVDVFLDFPLSNEGKSKAIDLPPTAKL